MLKLEVLVVKFGAVDRLPASTISGREITTLDHELLDDSVETRAFVVEWCSSFAIALFASAKSSKVVRRQRYYIVVELEGNTTCGFVAD